MKHVAGVVIAGCLAAPGLSEAFGSQAVELGQPSEDANAGLIAALNAETFGPWRDHIRAQASELRWMEIPWQSTFAEGMIAASEAGKPMLFWAMNGHPMGCT